MKPGITIALVLLLSCGSNAQTGKTGTVDALRSAYQAECIASARYALNAEAARNENMPVIARLFDATSKAESIHAANHRRVLLLLGITVDQPVTDSLRARTTAENLAGGIRSETYEYLEMYPPLLKTAENEKVPEAMVSFRYALETEKRHAVLYKTALDALNRGDTGSLSPQWFVCPTCGNTYDQAGLKVSCEFCGTLRPRFIIF